MGLRGGEGTDGSGGSAGGIRECVAWVYERGRGNWRLRWISKWYSGVCSMGLRERERKLTSQVDQQVVFGSV